MNYKICPECGFGDLSETPANSDYYNIWCLNCDWFTEVDIAPIKDSWYNLDNSGKDPAPNLLGFNSDSYRGTSTYIK